MYFNSALSIYISYLEQSRCVRVSRSATLETNELSLEGRFQVCKKRHLVTLVCVCVGLVQWPF